MKSKKHDYVQGDIVSYKIDQGKTKYFVVIAYMEGTILGKDYYNEDAKPILIHSSFVTYCPPVKVAKEKLRAYFRCEIPLEKMTGNIQPLGRLFCDEPYAVTLSDMLAVLRYCQKVGFENFVNEWLYYIYNEFQNLYDIGNFVDDEVATDGYRFLPNESSYVNDIYFALLDWFSEDTHDMSVVDALIEKTEKMILNLKLPIPERSYSDEEKDYFMQSVDLSQNMLTASNEEITLYRKFVEELCQKGNETAMRIIAFSCYCGNRAYETDWFRARDMLLALMETEDIKYIANALGYIYYYGRCNDGVPEYEKAFYYFSIGSACNVVESQYKISDMFLHGYAVPKNIKMAYEIIDTLYIQTLQYLFYSNHVSKLPDVALRKGDILLASQNDPDEAFYYYLQAEFAIRMRMMEEESYGDERVAEKIRNAIREILPQTSFRKPKYIITQKTLEYFLRNSYSYDSPLKMELVQTSNGQYKATIQTQPDHFNGSERKLFLTVPDAHFCGYKEKISLHTTTIRSIQIEEKDFYQSRAVIPFDKVINNTLYFRGDVIAEIDADWKLTLTKPENMKSYRFVSACYPDSDKRFDYLCDFPGVVIGQKIPIRDENGSFDATVVGIIERKETEMPFRVSSYHKMVTK